MTKKRRHKEEEERSAILLNALEAVGNWMRTGKQSCSILLTRSAFCNNATGLLKTHTRLGSGRLGPVPSLPCTRSSVLIGALNLVETIFTGVPDS